MFAEKKVLRIALAGNPNSGKSTLFNSLTGLHQKTGNFPGVTVDKKTGHAKFLNPDTKKEQAAELIDLPGTYSLYPKSPDEKVSFEILTDPSHKNYPDITIIVADASNLKRNLLFATQVMDLKRPVLLALNMIDVAQELGYRVDAAQLERELGIPVVALNSRQKKGLDELKCKLFSAKISSALYKEEDAFKKQLPASADAFFSSSSSFGAMLRLASVSEEKLIKAATAANENTGEVSPEFYRNFERTDNLARFKLINSIWEKCVQRNETDHGKGRTEKIDKVLTHRFFGIGIFLLVLFLIFQSVFFLAEFPMKWIEDGFSILQSWMKTSLPAGALNDLVRDGILAGLSGIVVFVPQIALLFCFIAILEDTGYMARVSFIMDKLMRGFGLNGRSVIPLISGVACAVPAIMGARTIGNVKERLITILVTPLMSCSARLPVYTLLISLMIPDKQGAGFFNERGLWLMGLYLLGFVAAIVVALILKFILHAKERSYFIMELPVYRLPQWKTVGHTIFEKVKVFLWDAGKVIMAISIVLWFLSNYGPAKDFSACSEKLSATENQIAQLRLEEKIGDERKIELLESERVALQSQRLGASYIGRLGKFIEPAIAPLGFDWKIGISLITSFAAREVFVGTMATIYSSGSDDEKSVREKMAGEKNPENGKPVYSRAVCISLLIFYAFAMQCMSTLAVVRRETNSWKWPLVQFLFMGGMAWLGSFIAFTIFN
jgi:ferrous iron transport protein B